MGRIEIVLPDRRVESLPAWFESGGGDGLEWAKELGPEETIAELERAGLRGRGGAGFPTATKWRSVRRGAGRHRYAVCNGAAGRAGHVQGPGDPAREPVSSRRGPRDRRVVAAARARCSSRLKASFGAERERVMAAVTEMEQAGLVGDLSIGIVAGPEEYLFGEEKALLEVIEGNDPLPRWLPPYVHGLFATAPQLGWQAHEPEPGHSRGHESNPTRGQQRRDAGQRRRTSSRTARTWYRSIGTAAIAGHGRVHGRRRRRAAGRRRGRVRHAAARGPRRCSARRDPGRAIKAVLLRRDQRGAHRRAARHAAQLRDVRGGRQRARRGRVHRLRRHRVHGRRRGRPLAVLVRRVVWAVPAVQARHRRDHRARSTTSAADAAPTTSLDSIDHWLAVVADGNRCFLPVEEQQLIGQHPAHVPRRLRHRTSKARARARTARSSRSSSTSPTAARSSTSARCASDPTGPTNRKYPAGDATPASAVTARRSAFVATPCCQPAWLCSAVRCRLRARRMSVRVHIPTMWRSASSDGQVLDLFVDDAFERGEQRVVGRDA